MGIKAVSAIPGATGLFKGQRVKFMRGFLAPTISYQFLSPPNIDPSLTFTRSTTATYFNSSGILSTVAANVPRFDYNPTTLALNGLLIEQQSTNLLTYSGNVAGASWAIWQGTISGASSVLAPDGVTTVYPVVINTASQTHFLNQAVAITAGGTYTYSIYLKAGTWNKVAICFESDNDVNGSIVFIDLNTGILSGATGFGTGTYVSSNVNALPNNWYRVSITGKVAPAQTFGRVDVFFSSNGSTTAAYTGNGTDSFYAWGAQIEQLSFATSYIPTTSAAVTRSADSLVNTSIGSWYNVTQGTLLTEYYIPYSINLNRVTEFNDGTYNNRIFLNSSSSALQEAIFAVNGTGYLFNAPSISGITKAGISYGGSAQLGAHNGSFDGQYVGGVTPSTITTLNLGGGGAPSGSQMNGWLRSFQYFNTALTSSQLQTISGQL